MVHRPMWVGTIRDCLLLICAVSARADQCLDGWHCQVLWVSTGHSDLVDLRLTRTCLSRSANVCMDVPWKGSAILDLHVVKTTCDLNMSPSHFGQGVTT